MALVKFGGGITEMRGSLAGNVYSRNRYCAYARARTKPINPNTAGQQAVRGAIAFLCARWSDTLTAAQRTAWNLYGDSVAMKNKLGETIYLTGFNHFIRSNAAIKRSSLPLVDDGPVLFELPAKDPTFALSASEATQEITTTFDDSMAWDNETGGMLWVYQGQPQNAQRNFFGGPWRIMGVVQGADGAPVVSPVVHSAVFGIAEGQRQWCYARIQRADGRLSEMFRADTFCAA